MLALCACAVAVPVSGYLRNVPYGACRCKGVGMRLLAMAARVNVFRYWRFFPLLLVMGTILYLSSLTGSSLPRWLQHYDKILHAVAYGALAVSTLTAVQPLRLPRLLLGLATLLFCTAFGILDELYQSRVYGRIASGWDLLADFTGAAIVVSLWLLISRWAISTSAKKKLAEADLKRVAAVSRYSQSRPRLASLSSASSVGEVGGTSVGGRVSPGQEEFIPDAPNCSR
jgi:VanZ family protein